MSTIFKFLGMSLIAVSFFSATTKKSSSESNRWGESSQCSDDCSCGSDRDRK